MSLLTDAKKVQVKASGRPGPVYTRQQEELAVAYFRGEIRLTQAASVLGTYASGSGVSMLASILTQGVRAGTIKIKLATPRV